MPESVSPPVPGTGNAESATLDRRSFLKAGLGGSVMLATASLSATLTGCATTPAGSLSRPTATEESGYQFRFLSADDIVLFKALVPAILGNGLPEAPASRREMIDRTIERIDAGIDQFGPPNQKELRSLFDLLNFSVTRVTVARVWSDWPNASTESVQAFLTRWEKSSVGLFNNAYNALTKLTNVAYFGHQSQWAICGYSGPPEWAVAALPQFQANA